MAVYFFDSSGVAKRYVSEIGTDRVIGITDPAAGNHIYVARITGVKVISAVARRARGDSLSATDKETAFTEFRHDFANQYLIIEITPALIISAMALAETHALRGYDAVQLAAAKEVNGLYLNQGIPGLTLVSADAEPNTAAMTEGLTVENPNDHP